MTTNNTNSNATTEVLDVDDLLSNPFGNNAATMNAPVIAKQAADLSVSEVNADDKLKVFNSLPAERQAQAQKLSEQLNENNAQGILEYGSNAQKQLGTFSQSLLNQVQMQDSGDVGDVLGELMFKLSEANPNDLVAEDKNVFRKLFGKVKKSVYEMTSKYQMIGAQIDKIAVKLEDEKSILIKDNNMLEQLYGQNKTYFDALNVFIAAGEIKLDELLNVTIPEAVTVAETSTNQMDVQHVQDLNQFYDRLEKRTHDLKLARQISIQQAPQIRLIQNTNQALAEKIQSSINTAIPLWKNQVAISLTLLRQKDAVTAQRQVSQTTNDLLKKNSEMLKISSIETAKENERGLIDIETLQQTQTDLVDTLQETLQIQQDGRVKRKEAERELSAMENKLRDSLLQLTTGGQQQ